MLDIEQRQHVLDQCIRLARDARGQNEERLDYLHRILAAIYDYRFSVPGIELVDADLGPLFTDIASLLEPVMFDLELEQIEADADVLDDLPVEGEAFLDWLKRTLSEHPAGTHPFYRTFLREEADVESVKVFLAQETTLDPRFDDILALMQVGTRGAEKMEIAKNYFDEMGCGDELGVHTYLFGKALDAVGIDDEYLKRTLLPASRVSGNLSACLVVNQRHHYKALGYYGVSEYLAPRRFKDLVAGWRRLGLPEEGLAYHDLHIRIDAVHGKAWFDNVIRPLVDHDPRVVKEIAVGALIRLNSSERYLASLHQLLARRQGDAYPDAAHA
ncbi:iron-containing redox enzyme family protein [Trinickia dinghuensis]|uniref:iron-containing redox enzyme family protein n=1 Tax=Trinickia dinghuensis TaxID=2291023 RepID=UPI0015F1533D|nr:iron-containing redox enzyme family protein [Trinickia dinghuensis]